MRGKGAKYLCSICAVLCFIGFTIGISTLADAKPKLTITSFGGSFQAAQRKAYFEPFAKKYDVEVIEDEWHGDMAKLRAMVESGNVTWDVLDVSSGQAELGCDEGLLEPLDISMFGGKGAFIEGGVIECGVGTLMAAVVIGYDARQFAGNEPTKLADFWDVKRFPGPRAMKKWPKHNMEFALMADGVPPDKVYEMLSTEAGIARAFRKLDEIKPHVKVWFGSWAQPGQLLADGEVAMSTTTNGRLAAAAKAAPSLKIVWEHSILAADWWSVVKGSGNKDLAIKFIQFASQPENQAEFSKHIAYGPMVKAALDIMSPELRAEMPTAPQNMQSPCNIDSRFWSDNMDDFNVRFNAWLGK